MDSVTEAAFLSVGHIEVYLATTARYSVAPIHENIKVKRSELQLSNLQIISLTCHLLLIH